MFDDQAFSTTAFASESWLFAALATLRREVVRLVSAVTTAITLMSRL